MSDHNICSDCGGTDENHFNDCVYDGTSGRGGYSGGRKSNPGLWAFLILLAVFGFAFSPVILALLLLGLYVYGFVWMFK